MWESKRAKKYFEQTKNRNPRNNVVELITKIDKGKALELGFGAGVETIYLLKNTWKVTAIDKNLEGVEYIKKLLNEFENNNVKFIKMEFENLELEKDFYDLVIANDSLYFCKKETFEKIWNKVISSIKKQGYFTGIFLGVNDSWNKNKNENITFFTKKEIQNLFKEFENISIIEKDFDGKTANNIKKHWHRFIVTARKK